jgi:hypothetical protein
LKRKPKERPPKIKTTQGDAITVDDLYAMNAARRVLSTFRRELEGRLVQRQLPRESLYHVVEALKLTLIENVGPEIDLR